MSIISWNFCNHLVVHVVMKGENTCTYKVKLEQENINKESLSTNLNVICPGSYIKHVKEEI